MIYIIRRKYIFYATEFGDETTSFPFTGLESPTPVQETFSPSVLAELMASAQNRSIPYPLVNITLEEYHAFSAAQLNVKNNNLTKTAKENAILAIQTLQRFLNAEKRIQEILRDLNGRQTSELTLELSKSS